MAYMSYGSTYIEEKPLECREELSGGPSLALEDSQAEAPLQRLAGKVEPDRNSTGCLCRPYLFTHKFNVRDGKAYNCQSY